MSERRNSRKVNEASNWMSPPSNPYLPLYAITCPCCSVSWVTPDQHCLNIFILLFHGNNVTKVKSPRMDEIKGMSWVEFNLKLFSLSRESEFNLALLQGWRDCRQIPYLHWIIFNYQSWKMSNLLHGPISTTQILPGEKRVNRDIFGTSNVQNKTYGVSCDE